MRSNPTPPRPFREAGRWLAQERRKRQLSQDQIAVLIGVRQATISKYESGIARPSDQAAAAIAQVFRLNERTVRRALGLYVPSAGEVTRSIEEENVIRLPAGVELTEKQRKALDAILDAFLDDLAS